MSTALTKDFSRDGSRSIAFNAPSLLPGQFHPRIWRNGWTATQNCPRNYENYPQDLCVARRAAAVSVNRLLEHLAEVFETVEPSLANATAFGPTMRHLLILACTEVEAAWRGVLVANAYPSALQANAHLTRRDYVHVVAPMRLNEYVLRLAIYQDEWTEDVAPFRGWSQRSPGAGTLPWYDAYNAAKHDRENARHRADLRAAINPVAAAFVLLPAQFGESAPEIQSVLNHRAGFELVNEPAWSGSELYFPADEHGFQRCKLFERLGSRGGERRASQPARAKQKKTRKR